MQIIEATCPICHKTGEYGVELYGRYTLCVHCRQRFYIEVPTLAESEASSNKSSLRAAVEAKPDETTLDDLLWDTQQGARHIIHSMRNQGQQLKIATWLLAGLLLVGIANLIAIIILISR